MQISFDGQKLIISKFYSGWGPIFGWHKHHRCTVAKYHDYDDSGYPHDGRADKNPYPHDRCANKDSYPHDSNNQYIILRLQLSFLMINVQLMLV